MKVIGNVGSSAPAQTAITSAKSASFEPATAAPAAPATSEPSTKVKYSPNSTIIPKWVLPPTNALSTRGSVKTASVAIAAHVDSVTNAGSMAQYNDDDLYGADTHRWAPNVATPSSIEVNNAAKNSTNIPTLIVRPDTVSTNDAVTTTNLTPVYTDSYFDEEDTLSEDYRAMIEEADKTGHPNIAINRNKVKQMPNPAPTGKANEPVASTSGIEADSTASAKSLNKTAAKESEPSTDQAITKKYADLYRKMTPAEFKCESSILFLKYAAAMEIEMSEDGEYWC